MKSILLLVMVFFIGMSPLAAHAGHTVPDGSIDRLHQDAHNLNDRVQNSWLNYRVKRAVYTFTTEVSAFYKCVSSGPHWDHTLPETCEHHFPRVWQTWYSVDRSLYDTSFDFPQVYNTYLRVRQDLQVLPH